MNIEHYNILKSGVDKWNQWRKENPGVTPETAPAKLSAEHDVLPVGGTAPRKRTAAPDLADGPSAVKRVVAAWRARHASSRPHAADDAAEAAVDLLGLPW